MEVKKAQMKRLLVVLMGIMVRIEMVRVVLRKVTVFR